MISWNTQVIWKSSLPCKRWCGRDKPGFILTFRHNHQNLDLGNFGDDSQDVVRHLDGAFIIGISKEQNQMPIFPVSNGYLQIFRKLI